MDANNIFNPVYRQDYLEGYSFGLNLRERKDKLKRSEAFLSGFGSGRQDYERMNGPLADGIPQRIVSRKVLEDFLLAGILGLGVDADGYTPHQLGVIAKWYQSGTEQYDPAQSDYLLEILQMNGIELY